MNLRAVMFAGLPALTFLLGLTVGLMTTGSDNRSASKEATFTSPASRSRTALPRLPESDPDVAEVAEAKTFERPDHSECERRLAALAQELEACHAQEIAASLLGERDRRGRSVLEQRIEDADLAHPEIASAFLDFIVDPDLALDHPERLLEAIELAIYQSGVLAMPLEDSERREIHYEPAFERARVRTTVQQGKGKHYGLPIAYEEVHVIVALPPLGLTERPELSIMMRSRADGGFELFSSMYGIGPESSLLPGLVVEADGSVQAGPEFRDPLRDREWTERDRADYERLIRSWHSRLSRLVR